VKDEMIMEKLQNIFRDVFHQDALVIQGDTSATDIEAWDSLAQIRIVSAAEEEFDIKFSLSELTTFQNVGEMAEAISKRLK